MALTADDTDNAKTNTTNLFANNDLTALTTNDTDNAKTNTTIKKFKKSTTTTKEPKPTSIIRKFVPPHLDVSFYCFHLIIFIKLIFNIFIIFLYQPALASIASSSSPSTGVQPALASTASSSSLSTDAQPALASTASSSSPSTGASSTISSRQQQSKKTAEGAFIV